MAGPGIIYTERKLQAAYQQALYNTMLTVNLPGRYLFREFVYALHLHLNLLQHPARPAYTGFELIIIAMLPFVRGGRIGILFLNSIIQIPAFVINAIVMFVFLKQINASFYKH